ncbi:hypothetical protein R3P38DRAFT_2810499 [Favolaschia claudopus]|uniref:Uncharacterized protein n=1 Tax=Favolaschia claudopus TaxID=2862362 RepID=A0AAV9ZBE4_9AGAR
MARGEGMQSNVGEGVAGATNDVKKSTTPTVDVSIHPKEREKERFKQSASGGRRIGDDTSRASINVGATREHAGTARRRDNRTVGAAARLGLLNDKTRNKEKAEGYLGVGDGYPGTQHPGELPEWGKAAA